MDRASVYGTEGRGFESLLRHVKNLAQDVRELRAKGLTYPKIAEALGCSKSVVSYHLSPGQKDKVLERTKGYRETTSILTNLSNYKYPDTRRRVDVMQEEEISGSVEKRISDKAYDFRKKDVASFSAKDVMDKFGDNPICYLSGRQVSLDQPRTYHFDHITPRSKGGSSSIDNLGLTTREANIAKSNLSVDELVELCKDILTHNGYVVTKGE